jgi:hypothetical protein
MRTLALAVLAAAVAGCAPTVQVKAPEEPITINLNVKIEHEIRVKVDRELEDLFEEEEDIF